MPGSRAKSLARRVLARRSPIAAAAITFLGLGLVISPTVAALCIIAALAVGAFQRAECVGASPRRWTILGFSSETRLARVVLHPLSSVAERQRGRFGDERVEIGAPQAAHIAS
jgi:hypothetical protein